MKNLQKNSRKNFRKFSDTLLWPVPPPFFCGKIKGSKKYKGSTKYIKGDTEYIKGATKYIKGDTKYIKGATKYIKENTKYIKGANVNVEKTSNYDYLKYILLIFILLIGGYVVISVIKDMNYITDKINIHKLTP